MKILQQTKKNCKNFTVEDVKIESPLPNNLSDHVRIGLDPGTTKMGIAYVWKSVCHVYEIHIIRDDDPVNRILLAQDILTECIHFFDYAPLMVIEGSSFNGYRQTELAEIRASAVLWAIKHAIKPSIVPPMSIRKKVFGSAKIKAEEQWAELPPDAASALACAYYSTIL